MAVYTEVSDEDLETFMAAYNLGTVTSFKGIAEGVENSNYILHTTDGSFILTLYEKRVAPEDLPFFLGLMDHLAGAGISCPTPIKARDGVALRTLCGRPAALISFLEGLSPRRIHAEQCGSLGDALARMHIAGQSFPMERANSLSVGDWRPLLDSAGDAANSVQPTLVDELTAELSALETAWPDAQPASNPEDLPRGVIHADLFPNNAFFMNDEVSGIIDFYFACTDFLAYDVAICLNAWCFEPDNSFNVTKARRMLAAYQAVRPLTAKEMALLPLFARGSALRFLLTRLYDWLNTPEGAFVKPLDPLEYLAKNRFHRSVTCPGDYGLEAAENV